MFKIPQRLNTGYRNETTTLETPMAFLTDLHGNPPQPPFAFAGRLFKTLRLHLLYKRTVRELSALDKRELDDLGISKSNIHEIARRSTYGAE